MNITKLLKTIIRSENDLVAHKKLISDKTLYDDKHQAIYKRDNEEDKIEFKQELYYVSPMVRQLSEDSRMRYYNLNKDLSKMDDLVKYMNHKADVAMDHSNIIFQAQVKKNGYMMGNCRFVGKGKGISFPDGIWKIIKAFAIPDCAVPPVLSKNFRAGKYYQHYCSYNKRYEGPSFRFCGYTNSGQGKFRKLEGDTLSVVKRVRLTRKPGCPTMPDDFTNNNVVNQISYYNSVFDLPAHVMYGTAYKFLGVYCLNGGGLYTTLANSGYSKIWKDDCAWGQELDDLRKICYINYAADDIRRDYRVVMDYNAGRTILDLFDKNNLKTYWIEIINRNIAEIKRRYLWLYKKANGDELELANYENNREYWDYVFINNYIKIAKKGSGFRDDRHMNRIGLTDEDRRIKALSHHDMRREGNRIGEIFAKYLVKIKDRKRKYCRQQTGIATIQLAAKGAVTKFFDENELSACRTIIAPNHF